MKVGIHYEPLYTISTRLSRYENILKCNGIDVEYVSSSSDDFLKKVETLEALVWYVGLADTSKQPYYNLLPIIEEDLNVKCFPSFKTSWSFDNKKRQIHQLQANKFPIIKSWIAYEKKAALSLVESLDFPIIFKLSAGAGSLNVIKINHKKDLVFYINKMFDNGVSTNFLPNSLGRSSLDFVVKKAVILKNKLLGKPNDYRDLIKDWSKQSHYLLLQKYIPNNEFDTRVTTIGDRAFAFRRFNRPGDFRSSGSGIIDYSIDEINIECIKLALKISKYFQFETMAYDFLFDEENVPVICEYSYGYNDEAVYKCSGYWDENLNFIEGHYWPQYLHLKDLLNMPTLKQPEEL